ncbi:unnamed protein product, partial [Hapterophycus canaliculatus]
MIRRRSNGREASRRIAQGDEHTVRRCPHVRVGADADRYGCTDAAATQNFSPFFTMRMTVCRPWRTNSHCLSRWSLLGAGDFLGAFVRFRTFPLEDHEPVP